MRKSLPGSLVVCFALLLAACSESGDDSTSLEGSATTEATGTSEGPSSSGERCPGTEVGSTPLTLDPDEYSIGEELPEGEYFTDLAIAPDGRVFVAGRHTVWCIDGETVSEVYSRTATNYPPGENESEFIGIDVDLDGTPLIADWRNPRIFRVVDGELEVLDGSDDPEIGGSRSLAVGPDGTVFLTGMDQSGSTFVWALRDGVAAPYAGNGPRGIAGDGGPATDAYFYEPEGIFVDDDGVLYVADRNNARVASVDPDGTLTTLAGGIYFDDRPDSDALGSAADVAVDPDGNVYVFDSDGGDRAPGDSGIHRITGDDELELVLSGEGSCYPSLSSLGPEPCPTPDFGDRDLTRFDVAADGSFWMVYADSILHMDDEQLNPVLAWEN
jgi:hypothetical protein